MDSQTISWLFNFGACGVFIVLIYFRVFVPGPYVKKIEKALELREQEIDVLRKVNQDAVQTAANSNQLIGALKSIALERQEKGELNDDPVHKGEAL